MATLGRRELLLLLLGLEGPRASATGIGGITRLQKLIFLLEREYGLRPAGDGFEFTPYKAGPYSSRLYDNLELLENLGLVESEPTDVATEPEAAELEALSFEELMGASSAEEQPAADSYEERKYRLTSKGLEHVGKLLERQDIAAAADSVRKVKTKYKSHALNNLLRYVYTKYPEMTVESEIKDQVLGRRGRR